MSRWRRWLKEFIVLALLTAVGATVIGYLRAPSFEGAALPKVEVSKLYGLAYDSSVQPDKPYILHFWATWCPVCHAEAGNIDVLAKDEKVITVAVKSGGLEKIGEYMKANGLSFPVINDQNGAIAEAFKIGVFPTTIIVDRDGKVFWAESGYTTTWGLKLRLWLAEIF
ncbi:protein disulfide oxidoreductase [Sulfurimonas diazotrophicus]|uniref:Protein disulfide oxidoreductase n=1 Tax=Sulfurimonas diazotrophicus TaxID=3131939 RepID=A0ABZ3HAA5_9BACT